FMLRHGAAVATSDPTVSPTRVAAMMFRSYLSMFESRGLLEKLRPKMTPSLAAIVARPPFPVAWVESGLLYEMLELAGDATSYDDIRQIAYENTSQQTGQMIVPMLRTLLRLWGTTPATIFKNMSSVVSVQVKGTKLVYVPETDTSGVMEIDPSRVCNP